MRAALPLVVTAVAVALVVSCSACDDAPPSSTGTGGGAPVEQHVFELTGGRPWNDTLYYAVGEAIDGGEPYEGAILDDRRVFRVPGRTGEPWHVRSEPQPTAAERLLLWMVDARGVLGAGANSPAAKRITIAAPPRAHLVFRAPHAAPGPDAVTLVHEPTWTSATAFRDPDQGVFLAIWDASAGHAYRNVAPGRPWTIEDLAPQDEPVVIAAQLAGHHWIARRTRLVPGETLVLDAGAAPRGGGKVICEDGAAWLLLGGELPIPAPRITTSLHLRSVWTGVPPGEHAVRYPDGRVVPVTVSADAQQPAIRLPR